LKLSTHIRRAGAKLPIVRTYLESSTYSVEIPEYNVLAIFERILLREGVYIWQFRKTRKIRKNLIR
jgi:hypothetical protein